MIAEKQTGVLEVNPTKYRQVHGNHSLSVTIPPEFLKELGLRLGSNVRIELSDGKVVISNADGSVQPAAEPEKGKRK